MILVTGATGFIGARLAARLAADGQEFRCLVRNPEKAKSLPASAKIAIGDLTTGQGLKEAVEDVEFVYHLAGTTKALTNSDYYAGNATGTKNLLDACSENPPIRFVHVSSLAASKPVSVYGKSKLKGEDLVRGSSIADRSVVIRPPVVYGPGDTDVLHFFKTVAAGWIVSVGSKDARVSIIHVDDLIDALILAGRSNAKSRATYCVANHTPVRWQEIGDIAARTMNRTARSITLPLSLAYLAATAVEATAKLTRKPSILSRDKIREAQEKDWICDSNLARQNLSFTTQISLEQGLSQTLEWYKGIGWLKY